MDRLMLLQKLKEIAVQLSMFYGDNIEIRINVNKIMKNTELNITIKNM